MFGYWRRVPAEWLGKPVKRYVDINFYESKWDNLDFNVGQVHRYDAAQGSSTSLFDPYMVTLIPLKQGVTKLEKTSCLKRPPKPTGVFRCRCDLL